jgi:drug/metabolite transporter (DMT)-like permease
MTQDKPLLGIALMLGFCIVAPMGDTVAKMLGASVPLLQVLLIRFAVQAVMLLPMVTLADTLRQLRGRVLALTLLRTLLHMLGIAAMFTALRFLPLADAVAIVFVMPFFMLLLGWLILHEPVGSRRLLACAAGFIGMLLVVQPSFAEVGWPALLPVFVAFNFSVFMLLTRQIAKEITPMALQAASGVIAVVLLLPLLWLGARWQLPALGLIRPDLGQWALLIGIGVLGTGAHLLMSWSLRYAPSTTLAPMQYLEIPIATVLGYVFFQDLPNLLASLGIAITILAGVYVIFNEQANAARLLRSKPPEPQL